MEYYQQIFTIGLFAVHTFIFSLFIVPSIKNLKQIQHRLRGLIKPGSFFRDTTNPTEMETQKKQINDIIKIMDEYKLEYKETSNLFKFIYSIIGVTFITVLVLFSLDQLSEKNLISVLLSSISPESGQYILLKDLILFGYILFIPVLLIAALKVYIPEPKRITEWTYLVDHFGISPSGLAKCANLKIGYNPKGIAHYVKFDPKVKRPIRIFSNLELRGYKYWFFVYDIAAKEPVYIIVGTIDQKTDLVEMFPDVADYNIWYTDVGEFNAYKYRDKNLRMYFFVFDPINIGNTGNPYWSSREYKFEENVMHSSDSSVQLSQYAYVRIEYQGKSLNFDSINWLEEIPVLKKDEDETKNIHEVFEISKKYIKRNKKGTKVILEK